jgi:hypothetical protein
MIFCQRLGLSTRVPKAAGSHHASYDFLLHQHKWILQVPPPTPRHPSLLQPLKKTWNLGRYLVRRPEVYSTNRNLFLTLVLIKALSFSVQTTVNVRDEGRDQYIFMMVQEICWWGASNLYQTCIYGWAQEIWIREHAK